MSMPWWVCTSIRSSEQRKEYIAEFNANYSEYRDLHTVMEKVCRRFYQLEHRLRQHERNSPAYRGIKHQIIQEYQDLQRDLKYQEAKRQFDYLHGKLLHIRMLVFEYDAEAVRQGSYY